MRSSHGKTTGLFPNSNGSSTAGPTNVSHSSRNKDRVRDLAWKGHILEKPWDLLKNPVVLEFLVLDAGWYLPFVQDPLAKSGLQGIRFMQQVAARMSVFLITSPTTKTRNQSGIIL